MNVKKIKRDVSPALVDKILSTPSYIRRISTKTPVPKYGSKSVLGSKKQSIMNEDIFDPDARAVKLENEYLKN